MGRPVGTRLLVSLGASAGIALGTTQVARAYVAAYEEKVLRRHRVIFVIGSRASATVGADHGGALQESY